MHPWVSTVSTSCTSHGCCGRTCLQRLEAAHPPNENHSLLLLQRAQYPLSTLHTSHSQCEVLLGRRGECVREQHKPQRLGFFQQEATGTLHR